MLNQSFRFFLYSYITIAYTEGLGFDHEQTSNPIKHDASHHK